MAMQPPSKRTLPFIYFILIIFWVSLSSIIILFRGHLYRDLIINFVQCLSFKLPSKLPAGNSPYISLISGSVEDSKPETFKINKNQII